MRRFAAYATARELREACRQGSFAAHTTGEAPGFVQANLVILPGQYADDFHQFCASNAAPCPLLECTDPGDWEPRRLAPGADVRSDLPKYHIWREGSMVEECQDVRHLWDGQMRAFLLGCSFTWEDVLAAAQLCPRHIEEGRNVPMYNTSIPLKGAGPFQGQMVVSMRPYKVQDSDKVAEITGRYPAAHGQPVQVGQPSVIGVQDIAQPDYGQAVSVRDGEVPIFWACGVTPQNALRNAKLPLVITHAPGHMFVADITNDQLRSWKVPGEWRARPAEE